MGIHESILSEPLGSRLNYFNVEGGYKRYKVVQYLYAEGVTSLMGGGHAPPPMGGHGGKRLDGIRT